MTDPIADLLTRIRNAGQRRMKVIDVPYSKMKETIVKILADEKFIDGYEVITKEGERFKTIRISLRYAGNRLAIENLRKVSKPGIRQYIGYADIPKVLGGIGICILSTSKGVMTGEKAREQKIGGELLCTIY